MPRLGEIDQDPLWFACPTCGRAGRYRRATLIAQFGPTIVLPDLAKAVALWRGCQLAGRGPYDPRFLSGERCGGIGYDLRKMSR